METVTLLQTTSGKVIAIYASAKEAEDVRDRFNSDPFLDASTADPDAPYFVETWQVQGEPDGSGAAAACASAISACMARDMADELERRGDS